MKIVQDKSEQLEKPTDKIEKDSTPYAMDPSNAPSGMQPVLASLNEGIIFMLLKK